MGGITPKKTVEVLKCEKPDNDRGEKPEQKDKPIEKKKK